MLQTEHPIGALEEVADTVRRPFYDYQRTADERRQLGVDVGEASARMVAALAEAGFAEDEARTADVHALADGRYAPARGGGPVRDPPTS